MTKEELYSEISKYNVSGNVYIFPKNTDILYKLVEYGLEHNVKNGLDISFYSDKVLVCTGFFSEGKKK